MLIKCDAKAKIMDKLLDRSTFNNVSLGKKISSVTFKIRMEGVEIGID